MKHLGKILWMIPVAAHVGYFLATYEKLPSYVGGAPGDFGTEFYMFVVEWFALIGVANMAFLVVHIKLPSFKDKMLSVPGKEYWLAAPKRRVILVERLQFICETALLLMNIFFLAIYQNIYQTNAASPILEFPDSVLVLGFMIFPLALLAIVFIATMRKLAAQAGPSAVAKESDDKEEPVDEDPREG